jgi:hypothetical protein
MTCNHAHRLLARAADDPTVRDAALATHLAACADCRAEFESQRTVAVWLGGRPAEVPSPGFAARTMARLDPRDEEAGMLGLANWRLWGGALAPVAGALTLAAWLGVGPANGWDVPAGAETFASWTHSATDERVSLFLQSGTSTDVLLETVLIGGVPEDAGGTDVR